MGGTLKKIIEAVTGNLAAALGIAASVFRFKDSLAEEMRSADAIVRCAPRTMPHMCG
jgi:hypothetical protein